MDLCFRFVVFFTLSYGVDTKIHENRVTTLYRISFIGKEFRFSVDCKPGPLDWSASGNLDINNNIHNDNILIATGGLHKDAFHICLPKFGTETYCNDVKLKLDPKKWVNLVFSQTKNGNAFYFKVHVDGKLIFLVENKQPREFRNVAIDMGDAINPPKPGFYKNLRVAFQCSKSLSSKIMPLSRNRLLRVIHKIRKEYRISFSFKLNKPYKNMGNVITLLAPNIRNKHAVGTPVVFNVPGKNKFYICSKNPIKLSRCFSTPKKYPLKNWINIEISQMKYGEKYIHKIFVNGDELYTRENKFPQEFNNVQVYAGSPHHPSLVGQIKDLATNEHCQMNPVITRVNLQGIAPPLGTWGKWKPVSLCSVTCGGGVKKRYRLCDNQAQKKSTPSVCLLSRKQDGKETIGVFQLETISCNLDKCPVHGKWSGWQPYTKCTKKCGGGVQTSSRECASPAPSNGGLQCLKADGSGRRTLMELYSRACNTKPCPVHGGWGSWSLVFPCTKPCGGGALMKLRVCERPIPSAGGRKCRKKDGKLTMSETKTEKCNTKPCKVHGKWSGWQSYTKCNKKCGRGVQTRTRKCASPVPSNGGLQCVKSDGSKKRALTESKSRACNTKPCPVHGKWSGWQSYTKCTKKCGRGVQTRTRKCASPVPSNGGLQCVKSDRSKKRALTESKSRACNTKSCPVHGKWSGWQPYTTCTKRCGRGVQTRTRKCASPVPSNGGLQCVKSDGSKKRALTESKSRACNTKSCPVHGKWSGWQSYTKCTKKCGRGVQTRTRKCASPVPSNGGLQCVKSDGSKKRALTESKSRACNTKPCPVHGKWSGWKSYTRCTKKCGRGVQTRIRICASPIPSNGGLQCLKSDGSRKRAPREFKSGACNTKPCPVSTRYVRSTNYPQNAKVSSFCPAGYKYKRHACGTGAAKWRGSGSTQWGPYTSDKYLAGTRPNHCGCCCNCRSVTIECQR